MIILEAIKSFDSFDLIPLTLALNPGMSGVWYYLSIYKVSE